MTSSEIECELSKKDELILKQMDILEVAQVEKHNLEIKLMDLSESVRQGKKLLLRGI